jgi:hypothetical protein
VLVCGGCEWAVGEKGSHYLLTFMATANQGFPQILFFKVLNFKASTSDVKKWRDFMPDLPKICAKN